MLVLIAAWLILSNTGFSGFSGTYNLHDGVDWKEISYSIREGVTEELKAQDQMLWVQRMNNIRDRATELVNHELIYV